MRTRTTAAELRDRLLGVFPPDADFAVWEPTEADRSGPADLVAGLNFRDPVVAERLLAAGADSKYTIMLRIDEATGEVRKKERLRDVNGGTQYGEVTMVRHSRGLKWKGWLRFEKGPSFTYRTQDIRDPLVRAIHAAGWEVRNRLFRGL